MKELITSILILFLTFMVVPVHASDLTISSVTVSNIAIPKSGTSVGEYIGTATCSSDKYYVSEPDCYWSNESKTEMYDSNVFSKDTVYYYSIVLKTYGSYVFANKTELTINGGMVDPGMQIMIGDGGSKITFKNAYKVVCGSGEPLPAVASVTLSKDTFYYDGKVHKPKSSDITVLDQYGNQVSQSDYTTEYSGKCKKVGVYTLTVTGKDLAQSTASTTFTINPSTPRSVRAAGGSGSVKVKWSRPKSGKPDYYDVFVYKDSACKEVFTSARVAKTSKTIGGLRSGMTYYVKVDCFVRSDVGYLVSKPSGAKAVTVK